MQWLYKARIEKRNNLYKLSRDEIQFTTRNAARIEDELKREFESFKKDSLAKEAAELLNKTIGEALDASQERSPEIISSLTQKRYSSMAANGQTGTSQRRRFPCREPWIGEYGSRGRAK